MIAADIRLETGRLLLRPPRIEDFDGYAELLADVEAARFIGGDAPRAGAWRRFLQQPGAWFVQGFGMFSVLDRATGEWLGQTGPWRPEGWPGNEIGWAFRRAAWGQGYATEATRAAIDWALDGDDRRMLARAARLHEIGLAIAHLQPPLMHFSPMPQLSQVIRQRIVCIRAKCVVGGLNLSWFSCIPYR